MAAGRTAVILHLL